MITKRQSASDVSAALRTALRKRYAAPQWALMEEVRDRVGFSGKRSADAIASGAGRVMSRRGAS